MHAVDDRPPARVVTAEPYAPFPVTADADRWGLQRTVVPTDVGPVVVHHRPGPAALLLLHGVAGSWTTWTPLLSAADGIDDRGLVLVDLPGWGASPVPVEPLGVDRAASVLTTVLDALAVPDVDVVGHSMGAFVGMHLAVVAPGRVRSVALVSGTTVATAGASRHPVRGLLTLPRSRCCGRASRSPGRRHGRSCADSGRSASCQSSPLPSSRTCAGSTRACSRRSSTSSVRPASPEPLVPRPPTTWTAGAA